MKDDKSQETYPGHGTIVMNCFPTLSADDADRALYRYADPHLQAGMADHARGSGFEFLPSSCDAKSRY